MKMITTCIQAINVPVTVFLCYLFVKVNDYGFFGIALAYFLAYLSCTLSLLVILFFKYEEQIPKVIKTFHKDEEEKTLSVTEN